MVSRSNRARRVNRTASLKFEVVDKSDAVDARLAVVVETAIN